MFTVNMAGQTL